MLIFTCFLRGPEERNCGIYNATQCHEKKAMWKMRRTIFLFFKMGWPQLHSSTNESMSSREMQPSVKMVHILHLSINGFEAFITNICSIVVHEPKLHFFKTEWNVKYSENISETSDKMFPKSRTLLYTSADSGDSSVMIDLLQIKYYTKAILLVFNK